MKSKKNHFFFIAAAHSEDMFFFEPVSTLGRHPSEPFITVLLLIFF